MHEYVRRIEHSLTRKRTALGILLDIVGALTISPIVAIAKALRELEVSPFLVVWIENLLRHRKIQVELHGEILRVVKGNPQGGILSSFCGTVS